MATKRTEAEIHKQIDLCADGIESGASRYPGLTYEEGVRTALEWVTGESDEEPMEEE